MLKELPQLKEFLKREEFLLCFDGTLLVGDQSTQSCFSVGAITVVVRRASVTTNRWTDKSVTRPWVLVLPKREILRRDRPDWSDAVHPLEGTHQQAIEALQQQLKADRSLEGAKTQLAVVGQRPAPAFVDNDNALAVAVLQSVREHLKLYAKKYAEIALLPTTGPMQRNAETQAESNLSASRLPYLNLRSTACCYGSLRVPFAPPANTTVSENWAMTAEDVRKAKENKATRSESDLSGDSEDSDSEDSGRTSANTGAVPLASVLNLRGFRAELTVRKNWAMTAENVRAAKEKALKTFLGFEHGVPCRLEEDARTVLGLEIDRNKYWPEKEKKKKLNETQLRCLEDYLVLCLWDAEKAARAGEDDSLVSGFGGLSAAQTALKSDATFGTHFQARF